MEVPHHAHTPRKKWTHYFWEFFMLFLAVFCGFLAENTREQIVEKKRAKEFVRSMIEDLKKDTANFQMTYFVNDTTIQMMDSLIFLLKSTERDKRTSQLYYLARAIAGINQSYLSTDRTFSQMKSSGNLRLIENHEIADSITSYYYKIDQLSIQANLWENVINDYRQKISVVFDASVFQQMHKEMWEKRSLFLYLPNGKKILDLPKPLTNPDLANKSHEAITAVIASTHFLYTRSSGMGQNVLRATRSAINLIKLLQQHYHLKDE